MAQGNKLHTYYTVYDNRTDQLVILDGNAQQCADAMGITRQSFYSTFVLVKKGMLKKWHIEVKGNADD